jgi:arylsulfatase A-like enzyme
MNLLDDTWIIFTSDHGDMMGDHRMCAKSVFLEGSAHIPMIVRPPRNAAFRNEGLNGSAAKAPAGVRCGALVTLADVMPTVLSIAGIDIPGEADGVNMLDFAEKRDGLEDRVFYGASDSYYTIMKDGYKYNWTSIGGEELLFNMAVDQAERFNLAKKEPEIAAQLKEQLMEHMNTCGCGAAGKGVAGENAAVARIGFPAIKDAITGAGDVNKWPGFHSTYHPSDVLH